ncbi:hypothetical protein PFISCL1PPCAC_22054, partial [Pristionchus fissidentatus]
LRLLLTAALIAGAASYVYTCNEIKSTLLLPETSINTTQACVILPAAVRWPYNDSPYTWYLYETYLIDTGNNDQSYALTAFFETEGSYCITGQGPWIVRSDEEMQITCSSAQYKHAEIIFTFSSEEEKIVRASPTPMTQTYTKGTYSFVAPEGALVVRKLSINEGGETTLEFSTGAGASVEEEVFPLMPEKFVAGTTTIILGPVTRMFIYDDVQVQLSIASFDGNNIDSVDPGFDFTIMSAGMANDLQSSRTTLISTAYGSDIDSELYDTISVTGTIRMDGDIGTVIKIDCNKTDSGETTTTKIDKTSDLIFNDNCTSIDITYQGVLAQENIGRSSEVIYLRVSSNSDPILKPPTPDPSITNAPITPTTPSRRTTLPRSTTKKVPVSATEKAPDTVTTQASTIPTTSAVPTISFSLSVLISSLAAAFL